MMHLLSKIARLLRPRRPKCPECGDGRLHTTNEILDRYQRPGGGIKLYYGMRAVTDFEKRRETTFCDRCDYKIVREYEQEGATWV